MSFTNVLATGSVEVLSFLMISILEISVRRSLSINIFSKVGVLAVLLLRPIFLWVFP
jgi:hypothetical protein